MKFADYSESEDENEESSKIVKKEKTLNQSTLKNQTSKIENIEKIEVQKIIKYILKIIEKSKDRKRIRLKTN